MCMRPKHASVDPAEATQATALLIIAHEPLAHAFVQVADHVFGSTVGPLAALDIAADIPREQSLAAAQSLADSMNCPQVLVLVDIHGGPTPCAVALRLCEKLGERARLVGGLNVAMLLTALESRHLHVGELAQLAATAGRVAVFDERVH